MTKKMTKNSNLVKELKNKTILVTGGAGSVGSVLVKKLLEYPVKSVRALDVDEHALFLLKRANHDERLRILLGNILDSERVLRAATDVDIVIHTAAVKNLEISEFNALETIDININGTSNLIKMTIHEKPEKFLNVSTDKAADATNLYGTTKLLGEKLTSWAAKHIENTKFASVRFGNVIESRGNVFEVWNDEFKNKKPLSITNPNMERYFWHVEETVNFILNCIPLIQQGRIFIPKMTSYKIVDLANKISKNHKNIGLRPGEKMEEVLITDEEKTHAIEKENMWIIETK